MVQGATPALLQVAAWPTSVLYGGNRAAGLLMPRVVGHHEIHELYGPKQRRIEFPTAGWGFLVHAARNVAAAFETIHAHGHVVGDVNQGNIVVSQKATVMLIDCDSFQIAINSARHLCEVGVAHFTPPELHGRSFNGVIRTPNHDAFGLAVTLFHLLFLGRHPFAGRYQGRGDMPIEKAIVEHRFAYSQQAAARQMFPPPHTLSLAHVSFGLASLFERAFAPGSERGGRPTAIQWRSALEAYIREMRRCTACPAHSFHRSLPRCPLCDIERAVGNDFFLVLAPTSVVATGRPFDLEALWRQIQAVPQPETASALTSPIPRVSARPLPTRVRVSRIAAWLALAGVGATGVAALSLDGVFAWFTLGLFLLWRIIAGAGGLKSERAKRKAQLETITRQLDGLVDRTNRELDNIRTKFVATRGTLGQAREEYRQLPAGEQKDLQELVRQREATQKQHYLERFLIAHGRISGIGPSLTATLASYGFEAADDVNWNVGHIVPGFGPARTRDLMTWRNSIEAQFKFDPTKGVDPADQQAVRNRYARRRQELERLLRAGLADLQRLREQSRRQREHTDRQLAAGTVALAQAKADADLI